MKKIIYTMSLSLILLVSGCASIITGTDQNLTFNSEPDGATVTVAGKVVGKTPLSVQIDKGKNQSLTFEKEGYKTHTTQLSTSLTPWFWGNIVLGGLVGSTIDGVSGAINEFEPDQYFVTLTPETPFGMSTSKPRQIKEIIIAFGSEVRKQLVAGGGESVDALIEILELENTDKQTTLKALNKLANQYSNDLEFANSIIDVYSIK